VKNIIDADLQVLLARSPS